MDEQVQKKVAAFFSSYKLQSWRKGEILIRADDEPHGIFYLKEGSIKQYVISKKGEEVVLNIFKPGAFLPMNWALNATHNRYFFEAMTPAVTARASKDEVLAFLQKEPSISLDLLRRVYRGVDGLLMRMSYLMSENAHDRLIVELLIAARRFGTQGKEGEVTLKISEKELANQAGMTRETVSREIKSLKEKGLLLFTKNMFSIPHLQRLENDLLEE